MTGKFGSFIQMLRQYRLNIKRKKQKENRETKKVTKIIQLPFIIIVSLIGYFIEPNKKKTKIVAKKKLKINNKQPIKTVNEINVKIDQNNKPEIESCNKINKEKVNIKTNDVQKSEKILEVEPKYQENTKTAEELPIDEEFDELNYYNDMDFIKDDDNLDEVLESGNINLELVNDADRTNEKIVVKQTQDINEKKEAEKKKVNDQNIIERLILDHNKRIKETVDKFQPRKQRLSELSLIALSYMFNPFAFKLIGNRLLASIISGIIVNNTLKGMRNLLNPTLDLNYDLYYGQSKINVYLETLDEISLLRYELLLNYQEYEIADILEQLNIIESNYLLELESVNKRKNQKRLKLKRI